MSTPKTFAQCRFCGKKFTGNKKKEKTAMDVLVHHVYNSSCKEAAFAAQRKAVAQLDEKYGGFPGAYKEHLRSLEKQSREWMPSSK